MQNALPCDKPHKGGRDSTVHIQTGPQTAPSAPKSMQQRDAGHAPRVLPSSAAQLPVDAALNAHGLTLLMVLLYAFSEAKDTIVKDVVENVDLIPSNVNLSGAEIELIGVDEKEYIMKKIIDKVRRKYDYIIMDCPPSLNMLTINALTAANSVLVPIQCEYYALEGLSQLIHTIELVKERLNKKLVMEGVVFTMYDARTNLSLQVVENVKDNLQQNIYKTIIPRNVRLAEAPSYGQPITLYDTRSAGAEAYRLLAEEVINREGE